MPLNFKDSLDSTENTKYFNGLCFSVQSGEASFPRKDFGMSEGYNSELLQYLACHEYISEIKEKVRRIVEYVRFEDFDLELFSIRFDLVPEGNKQFYIPLLKNVRDTAETWKSALKFDPHMDKEELRVAKLLSFDNAFVKFVILNDLVKKQFDFTDGYIGCERVKANFIDKTKKRRMQFLMSFNELNELIRNSIPGLRYYFRKFRGSVSEAVPLLELKKTVTSYVYDDSFKPLSDQHQEVLTQLMWDNPVFKNGTGINIYCKPEEALRDLFANMPMSIIKMSLRQGMMNRFQAGEEVFGVFID